MPTSRSARVQRSQARAVWGPDVSDRAACAAAADATTLYLHLPKTAGSSVGRMAAMAPGWSTVRCFAPSERRPLCWCGRGGGCACATDPGAVDAARVGAAGRNLQISVGHSTLAQTEWLRGALADRGVGVERLVATVRPVRDRLRSMFRYYCSSALAPLEADAPATDVQHRRQIVIAAQADLQHYLRPDGSIDATAWFSEFARSTGGVVFFLDDVFGSPRRLRRALDRGLVVVPFDRLDAFCLTTYGVEPIRANVSALTESEPRMAAALAEAEATIEAYARRDDPYDAVLADHLGDPAFRV